MTTAELNLASNYIQALASGPDAIERIGLFISGLLAQSKGSDFEPDKCVSCDITFTKKELSRMSKTFKTEFVSNGFAAHVLKRQRSQNCTIFLIRYRRGEYNIVVSGNTMEKAKERFIEATSPKNIDKYRVNKKGGDKHTVEKIARDWLESKKGTIDPRMHRDYVMNCEARIIPVLGTRKISTITTNDLKQIIDAHHGRVIETLQTILKGIMNYAIANGEITFNPTLNRVFKRVMQDKEVTQYFLRHTFATTCVQYVRPDIVDTWMGDSSERLVGRVYTHFPDKFMANQMDLVQFEF